MKYLAIILLNFLLFNYSWSNTRDSKYVSVEELCSSGQLKALIVGTGGYQENCTALHLKNLSEDSLYVHFEAGRRMFSKNEDVQDIFIVKEQFFAIAPQQKKQIDGYGFCCQASNASPGVKDTFLIGKMAPDDWVYVAQVINANTFPAQAVQHAVWVISDNKPFSSIHDENMQGIRKLREAVAKIKNIEIPWYSMEFVKDTASLFSDQPLKLYGELSYYLKENTSISIMIRSDKGRLMSRVQNQTAMGSGSHTYNLNENILNWPKGEYTIYVYQDQNVLNMKKSFTIE